MPTIECCFPVGRHCDRCDPDPAAMSCTMFGNLARGGAVVRLTPDIAIDVGNYAKTCR
jgi:hypothetical protein